MASDTVPFLIIITYLRGEFELVTREGERFRLTAVALQRIEAFFDLMLPWTEGSPKTVDVGPYRIVTSGSGVASLPLRSADGTSRHFPVSTEWLRRMRPLFARALELVASPPAIGTDFSLEYDDADAIVVLPPDRTTLRPADSPPE
jgi:hypothetical protein